MTHGKRHKAKGKRRKAQGTKGATAVWAAVSGREGRTVRNPFAINVTTGGVDVFLTVHTYFIPWYVSW